MSRLRRVRNEEVQRAERCGQIVVVALLSHSAIRRAETGGDVSCLRPIVSGRGVAPFSRWGVAAHAETKACGARTVASAVDDDSHASPCSLRPKRSWNIGSTKYPRHAPKMAGPEMKVLHASDDAARRKAKDVGGVEHVDPPFQVWRVAPTLTDCRARNCGIARGEELHLLEHSDLRPDRD